MDLEYHTIYIYVSLKFDNYLKSTVLYFLSNYKYSPQYTCHLFGVNLETLAPELEH